MTTRDAHLASAERYLRRARTEPEGARVASIRLAAAHLAAFLREREEHDDEIAQALAASVVVARAAGGRGLLALIEGGKR